MRCTQCGTELRLDDRFCSRCGAPRPQLPPAFVQAQARMEALLARYNAGQIDPTSYEVQRRALTVQDPQGGHWSPAGDGIWYWYDGSAWVQREPLLLGAPAPPQQHSTGARHGARTRAWIAIAAAALVVAVVLVALSFWVGPRWLRPEPAATAPSVAAEPTQMQSPPGPTATPVRSAATAVPDAQPTPTPLPAVQPAANLGLSRDRPLPLNARAKTPSWEIQVLEVLRGEPAWQRILQDDPDAAPPPAGQEYLVARIRARCTVIDEYSHSLGMSELHVTGDAYMVHQDRLKDVPAAELVFMDFYTAQRLEGWIDVLVGVEERALMLVLAQVPWGEEPEGYVRYVALEEGSSLSVSPELSSIATNDLGADQAQPAPLGSAAVTEDWEITVLEVLRGEEAWTMVQGLYSRNAPPEEGMEYALARAYLRYIGSGELARSITPGNFGVLASDGTAYEAPRVNRADPLSPPWMQAGFYPGGEHEGWIPLQVPVGDAGAVLRFNPDRHESGSDEDNVRYLGLGP